MNCPKVELLPNIFAEWWVILTPALFPWGMVVFKAGDNLRNPKALVEDNMLS